MPRAITQPCVVIGQSDRTATLTSELSQSGVRFVSSVSSVGQLRRHLVLGEDASMVLCILLGVHELTETDRRRVSSLLADRAGFPTRVFCVGVLDPSQQLAEVAGLGCDTYASDTTSAIEMVRAFARQAGQGQTVISAQQLLHSMTVMANVEEAALAGSSRKVKASAGSVAIRPTRARTVKSTSGPSGGNRPSE